MTRSDRENPVLTLLLIVLAVLALSARPSAALSNPDDFCTGDPCIIAAAKDVDAGAVLDFGTRTVILQNQLNLGDLPAGGVGSVTIKARSLSIASAGVIKGSSTTFTGGSVTIETINDIQINGTASAGAIRLNGQDGGTLTLTTTFGSITGSGRINLTGEGYVASGGVLTITSAADVSLSGTLSLPGGLQAAGGEIGVVAAGDVSLTGLVDLTGGDASGGYLDVNAGGSLTLGEVDMSGSGDAGDGGMASVTVGGNVTIAGRFRGRGADNGESCGDGADVDFIADGDIEVNANIEIQGRGLDCTGGLLGLSATNVTVRSTLLMSGTGTEGEGGDLDIDATNSVTVSGIVQLDGGNGGGGDLLFFSDGDVAILGTINANGRTTYGPGSSLVDIDSDARITVSGTINASGGGSGAGGEVLLSACDVTTQPTAVIQAFGTGGQIEVDGNDSITLRGQFGTTPGSGTIDIMYGVRADPPDLAGASFSPPAVLTLNPLFTPCRICDTNADCADGNQCTSDVCDNGRACLNTITPGDPCTDSNLCTINDVCSSAGVCVSGPPPDCDDGNACTFDVCFTTLGCLNFPVALPCDDGDACTTDDICSSGACSGTPIDCGDGNPCTDDACSAGVCTNSPNTNPCTDGDACTTGETCSGGTCTGGSPISCSDGLICTADGCNPSAGCENTPIPGCADADNDGIIDSGDPCVTLAWSTPPALPPNQNPAKFGLTLTRLTAPDGEQRILIKGVFNVAPSALTINPAANGMHLYVADAIGSVFDLSIPGGATGCGFEDGWTTLGTGFNTVWKYRNTSGALPPACLPGSARGVGTILVKDARLTSKAGFQMKIKAKGATLDGDPVSPPTRLQISVALAAQPAPGVASAQALAGQCAEARFTGNPIPSLSPKPYCKRNLSGGVLDAITCKGP